ncbi:hypothetical protein FNF27_01284 [Cafeteria roenbergensis]|uniref:Enoyl reductase (ER) domain-containing protein n=1 Tax=Cafeteria roenbergensis TaxID=33653 RepID=A0A5A8D4Y5_CAFRO|nr:hypothetical protein FNF28_06623 [Cafeteria roenbergensis]KAA0156575.1 hypothetical protein FNF29_00686 [Cafeteria roenbergensis]KAA0159657.1 hypothetical protein FNF31_04733 [Cafeteria roenbergensis]KAA0177507.1 hypothetical protein FNF27_01284 [Cafeteria roenbergensis]|eukprot:KAA0156575.1 hypothetical protein FNF29_00686 [Cafeteria roenbergensis]
MAAARRAKVVAMSSFGDPSTCMSVVEAEIPAPKPGWLRVRVEAVSVNPKDCSVVHGEDGLGSLLWMLQGHPVYPGSDLAGTVDAVGDGVTDIKLGQRVATYRFWLCGAAPGEGAFGEYALVPADTAARIPEGLPVQVAAALPCAFLTALQVLRDRIRIHRHPAKRPVVVVYGASGGVGSPCVQIAGLLRGRAEERADGAFVIAVASERNRRRCLVHLGASAFVAYDKEDPWAAVSRIVEAESLDGVHAWIECHIPKSGPRFAQARPLLVSATLDAGESERGREPWMPGKFVSLRPSIPVALLTEGQRWLGQAMSSACSCLAARGAAAASGPTPPVTWLEPANDYLAVQPEREGLEKLMHWAAKKQIRVDIASEHKGLEPGLAEAVGAVSSKHTAGKAVVVL